MGAAKATRWLALLRPAVQLVPAGPGQPVIARLGGSPELPVGTSWPEWPGLGPLSFVAEVDLSVLVTAGLHAGLTLPPEGRLLAFYFDDPDGVGAVVYAGDPDSRDGSRLMHVQGTEPSAEALVKLAGLPVLTWPDREHPILERERLEDLPDAFEEALMELVEAELGPDRCGHQIGGWAAPVQGPVEFEAAETHLGEAAYDARHRAEALRWRPLLQVDSDPGAGTSWGDEGCLYWLARTDGTHPPHFGETAFTWQCG